MAAYRALGAPIGRDVYIKPHTWIRSPHRVAIGNGSRIGVVTIEGWGHVKIGRNVMINEDVSLYTTQHDVNSAVFVSDIKFVEIGDYAWLAHHILVLPGVRIGNFAVIGTGSVVTKDVPDYAVAGGNPARVLKERARITYTYRPNEPPV